MIQFTRKTIYVIALITITTWFIQTNIFAVNQHTSRKESTEKMQGCPICFPPKIKCPHCTSKKEYCLNDLFMHFRRDHAEITLDNKLLCKIPKCGSQIVKTDFSMHLQQKSHIGQYYRCPFCTSKACRKDILLKHLYKHCFMDTEMYAVDSLKLDLLEHIKNNHLPKKSKCNKKRKRDKTNQKKTLKKSSSSSNSPTPNIHLSTENDEIPKFNFPSIEYNNEPESLLPEENVTALQKITNTTYNSSTQEEDFIDDLMFFLNPEN
jgi:hypothetical protein